MGEKRKASEAYLAKLKDPRWQKMRLKILERDEFRCQRCMDDESTLHVHHRYYLAWGTEPWEYPEDALVTLCESCHECETAHMPGAVDALTIQFKRLFYAEDIERIAKALGEMSLPHVSEIWATSLEYLFKTRPVQDALIEAMFSNLRKTAEAMKVAEANG